MADFPHPSPLLRGTTVRTRASVRLDALVLRWVERLCAAGDLHMRQRLLRAARVRPLPAAARSRLLHALGQAKAAAVRSAAFAVLLRDSGLSAADYEVILSHGTQFGSAVPAVLAHPAGTPTAWARVLASERAKDLLLATFRADRLPPAFLRVVWSMILDGTLDRMYALDLAEHSSTPLDVLRELAQRPSQVPQGVHARLAFRADALHDAEIRAALLKHGVPAALRALARTPRPHEIARLARGLLAVEPIGALFFLEEPGVLEAAGLKPGDLSPLFRSELAFVRFRALALLPRFGDEAVVPDRGAGRAHSRRR
ncbi:MAG TPA: hypothetical protein VF178_13060 [Gemmatimonadaceae bacterium]